MATMTIEARPRELTGRKTNQLRAQGAVPAIMYGFETEPTSVELERNDLERLYKKAGESTVVQLSVGGSEHPVLIQDIQRDPLTGFITHADFRRINLDQKVEATIRLELEGIPPAVKEHGGTLIQSLEEVDVSALPTALVRSIKVDVTVLATFDDVIRVSDLQVPDGVEILEDAKRAIATVQPPRTEAEMEALDEAIEADVDAVEVTSEKGEDENAEGGAAEESKAEQKSE